MRNVTEYRLLKCDINGHVCFKDWITLCQFVRLATWYRREGEGGKKITNNYGEYYTDGTTRWCSYHEMVQTNRDYEQDGTKMSGWKVRRSEILQWKKWAVSELRKKHKVNRFSWLLPDIAFVHFLYNHGVVDFDSRDGFDSEREYFNNHRVNVLTGEFTNKKCEVWE